MDCFNKACDNYCRAYHGNCTVMAMGNEDICPDFKNGWKKGIMRKLQYLKQNIGDK